MELVLTRTDKNIKDMLLHFPQIIALTPTCTLLHSKPLITVTTLFASHCNAENYLPSVCVVHSSTLNYFYGPAYPGHWCNFIIV